MWIQHAQGLIIWLVERQRVGSGSESGLLVPRGVPLASPWVAQLGTKCSSALAWVELLTYLLGGYIAYTSALMGLEAQLEEPVNPTGPGASLEAKRVKTSATGPEGGKADGGNGEEEEDLVPLKVAKSLSLPIARQPRQGQGVRQSQSTVDASI
jgi:hypothetical protein